MLPFPFNIATESLLLSPSNTYDGESNNDDDDDDNDNDIILFTYPSTLNFNGSVSA